VGNPGNACEDEPQGCFGAVAYSYSIGKYEVSNTEYVRFLNSIAATDTTGLYNTNMGVSSFGGITRSGGSGAYTYSAIAGRENMPVNYVSFYDVLRFANWLHNGQPTGAQSSTTTEDGAYTFSGPTTVGARNGGAKFAVATEDEWYKAAYYSAGVSNYFAYPAGSNIQITCAAPTATTNQANCNSAVGDLTNRGSYTGSSSPYGTFDQGGNVLEWTETITTGTNRGIRGGYFGSAPNALSGSIRGNGSPLSEAESIGFRVVPEPDAAVLFFAGVLGVLGLAGCRSHHEDKKDRASTAAPGRRDNPTIRRSLTNKAVSGAPSKRAVAQTPRIAGEC
jgi:sulfatase modifying factor 1